MLETKELFTEEDIRSLSTIQSFRKGLDLFDDGAVESLEVRDRLVTAKVRGTRLYDTQVEFTGEDYDFSCSCPYDGAGLCKHRVALAMAVLERPDLTGRMAANLKRMDPAAGVDALIERAEAGQIKRFVKEAVQADPELLEKFRTIVHGQKNRESKKTVDSLRDRVREALESFDLSDYERFYESDGDFDGYREEWEVLRDGANDELEAIFGRFSEKIDRFLRSDDVINAAKHYLALYEGIGAAELENIEDEASIYDGDLSEEIFEMWETYSAESFVPTFAAADKEPTAVRRIVDLVFERVARDSDTKGEKNDFHFKFKPLTGFLSALAQDKESAVYMGEKLKQFRLDPEDTCEIRLEIAEKTGARSTWLKIAESHYPKNPDIAQKLLIRYESRKQDFVRVARKVAFLWEDRFVPYLYAKMTHADASDLYKKILFRHAENTERIAVYRKIKQDYGKKVGQEFLRRIGSRMEGSHFHIRLLEEEKAYAKILDVARSRFPGWDFAECVKPVLNVYPAECLELTSKKIEKLLHTQTGRNAYAMAASWVKNLCSIEDPEIKKKIEAFIASLLSRHSRRPALKDEFKKKGLA
jgi:hypothetical protein